MCVCKCVCESGVRKWVGWVGGRVGGWVGVGGHPVGVGWGVCVGGGAPLWKGASSSPSPSRSPLVNSPWVLAEFVNPEVGGGA